ncbi:hypothetical protein [Bacillus thuringiensis]|uniref:hypothetical protein n=1 Tax=Bacillus thuringiensis TaxID=1428 RepID=UPI0018CD71FE|nr:hypothetical protein [Bacillus thuringiensis]
MIQHRTFRSEDKKTNEMKRRIRDFLKHTKISSTDQGIGFVLLFFYSRSEETVASPLGS